MEGVHHELRGGEGRMEGMQSGWKGCTDCELKGGEEVGGRGAPIVN